MTVVALAEWMSSILWFFGGVVMAAAVVGAFRMLKAKRQREYQQELESRGRNEGGAGERGRKAPGT
jgi:hypothetical protein